MTSAPLPHTFLPRKVRAFGRGFGNVSEHSSRCTRRRIYILGLDWIHWDDVSKIDATGLVKIDFQ